MILRKWEVRPLDKERAAAFAQTYGVPFFLAMLMNIRGLDDAAHLREFLGEGEPLSDPFLLKDMDKAAARITRAVDNMEKIAVYGDYDADGVTSTAMLYSYLETRGADVIFYIPQREGEGYGMNIGAVEYLKEQGVSLIVTVDTPFPAPWRRWPDFGRLRPIGRRHRRIAACQVLPQVFPPFSITVPSSAGAWEVSLAAAGVSDTRWA